MNVGDLVKQVSWDGVGIITKVDPHYFVVLFSGVRYSIEGADLELISEKR